MLYTRREDVVLKAVQQFHKGLKHSSVLEQVILNLLNIGDYTAVMLYQQCNFIIMQGPTWLSGKVFDL